MVSVGATRAQTCKDCAQSWTWLPSAKGSRSDRVTAGAWKRPGRAWTLAALSNKLSLWHRQIRQVNAPEIANAFHMSVDPLWSTLVLEPIGFWSQLVRGANWFWAWLYTYIYMYIRIYVNIYIYMYIFCKSSTARSLITRTSVLWPGLGFNLVASSTEPTHCPRYCHDQAWMWTPSKAAKVLRGATTFSRVTVARNVTLPTVTSTVAIEDRRRIAHCIDLLRKDIDLITCAMPGSGHHQQGCTRGWHDAWRIGNLLRKPKAVPNTLTDKLSPESHDPWHWRPSPELFRGLLAQTSRVQVALTDTAPLS